jgi:hypothetical protein
MGYSYNRTDLFKAKEKIFSYSEPNLTLEIRKDADRSLAVPISHTFITSKLIILYMFGLNFIIVA